MALDYHIIGERLKKARVEKNMTQEKSFNLFNQIKQSHDFTDAEKVLLAEYQFDSAPFTGRPLGFS